MQSLDKEIAADKKRLEDLLKSYNKVKTELIEVSKRLAKRLDDKVALNGAYDQPSQPETLTSRDPDTIGQGTEPTRPGLSPGHTVAPEAPEEPGEDCWPCQVEGCGKRFMLKRNLEMHQEKQHNISIQRPFQCNQCSKSYDTEAALRRHLRDIHTAGSSYQMKKIPVPGGIRCTIEGCDYVASRPSVLRCHISIKHRGLETQDGSETDLCAIESEWQETALATDGIAADLFWQLGTTLSTGHTHDDGFTLYVGSDDWTCLVTEHIAAIG
ncbi:hypothetical protein F4778DRAFT_784495 [Xylariomycetidae sp. FL2044]|nr:hypothetical protein F4778DRAFT_784495 [Xylariomycetidae sp. FL2044]